MLKKSEKKQKKSEDEAEKSYVLRCFPNFSDELEEMFDELDRQHAERMKREKDED